MKIKPILIFLLLFGLFSCDPDNEVVGVPIPEEEEPTPEEEEQTLTLFFINDQHGQIDNFSKVKAIVDDARAAGNVLLVSAGDVFSGNPIVDQFSEKGFPMIDIMNAIDFDVAVLGNHEFDFGTEVLKDRIDQSNFPWILANINTSNSVIDQPDPYVTLAVGDFKVTFLGLIETNGKDDDIIPSTHPLRVADLSFQRHEDVADNYDDLKSREGSDLLVGLTHLGSSSDRQLAAKYPFFDLIIGGHSHEMINETINGIPIVQAGAHLQFLGRIDLIIEDQAVKDYTVKMINLTNGLNDDAGLAAKIEEYNDDPVFSQVVGQSDYNLQSSEVGCFYTTGLREYMGVDFTIQNLGGIRAGINRGPITRFEIFAMDPFNNQSVSFTKTVGEFEDFFCQTGSRFYFTGVDINTNGNNFQFVDSNGNPLPDNQELTMGVNDYIPAIYDSFFDFQEADIKDYTTAEAILGYLANINSAIDFDGCSRVLECD